MIVGNAEALAHFRQHLFDRPGRDTVPERADAASLRVQFESCQCDHAILPRRGEAFRGRGD